MPNTHQSKQTQIGPGFAEIRLSSWKHFAALIRKQFSAPKLWFWRGQRCDTWKLETTFDRLTACSSPAEREKLAIKHLENFRKAICGRRGPYPPKIEDDDDLWALGQHYGLATPLLDWTTSPFAAAFFAFEAVGDSQTERRAIYAINRLHAFIAGIPNDTPLTPGRMRNLLRLFRPLLDENSRLLSQGGWFSRLPFGETVEGWLQKQKDFLPTEPVLFRITIPDSDRVEMLKQLNLMNINHATLFPDLAGACANVNLELSVEGY